MGVFKKFILTSSVEIKTNPNKIWDFFLNLEDNYQKWYPEEHHFFKWVKGKPLEVGSKFDSLEIVDGHKTRLKGRCVEAVEDKIIAFKPAWPASFMCTKMEWVFESKGKSIVFIANTYFQFGSIFLALKKDTVKEILEITQRHMDQEGVNLKRILE
jgi:hypothetical protein